MPPTPAAPEDATERAYATLTRGEVASVDRTISELDSTLAAYPDAGRVSLYAGVFRLWKGNEGIDSVGDLVGALDLMDQAVKRLGSAQAMLPNDFRVGGFYGITQVLTGTVTLDDALVAAGKRTLDDAVAQFPAYNYFVRAAAFAGFPSDSPEFAGVIPDLFALTKACGYAVEADGVTFHYPTDPAQLPFPKNCLNEGIVPHVWEGMFTFFGDLMLKSGGGAEKARALYQSAKAAPAYGDWPFGSLLEERIRDVSANAAAFTDQDPFNDPVIWAAAGHFCTGCHQR